jgi:hypothetical protein
MMELEYKIEAEDGSGVYTMDMNDDEVRAMVDLGVQFAIVCGAAGVKPMDIMGDLLEKVRERHAETDRLEAEANKEISANAEDQK